MIINNKLSFVLISLITLSIFAITQPVFAEREISIQKVADIKENNLLQTLSDLSIYPQIFPDNIKSVSIIDNKTNLVSMNLGIDGLYFATRLLIQAYKNSKDCERHIRSCVNFINDRISANWFIKNSNNWVFPIY